MFSSHLFWTSNSLEVPAGVAQKFSSTVLLRCVPLIFSREEFSRSFPSSTVKSNLYDLNVLHLLGFFFFYLFSEKKSQLPGFELTSQRVRRLRGCQQRSAYIVLHVQKLRTCLQIKITKTERFAVETHHFKIQHAKIIVEGMASRE